MPIRNWGSKTKRLSLANDFVAFTRQQQRPASLKLAFSLCNVGYILNKSKAFAEADRLLTEAVAIYEKKNHKSWKKYYAISSLGAAKLGQEKLDETEPMLVEGYDGMNRLEKTMPAQNKRFITEALSSLVEFYELKGDEENAKIRREALQLLGNGNNSD